VLILAAVDRELAPARALLASRRYTDWSVSYALTGAGKSQAAALSEGLMRIGDKIAVFQIGCAGAFASSGLSVGDVAIATEEIFGDDGVETPGGFLPMSDLDLPLATRYRDDGSEEPLFERVPVDPPPSETLSAIRQKVGDEFRIAAGPLVTVSCGSGTDARAAELEARWHALAESFEGAAVAANAWSRRWPFHEIRGISNPVGDRDRAAWDIDRACENAARVLFLWLERFDIDNPKERLS